MKPLHIGLLAIAVVIGVAVGASMLLPARTVVTNLSSGGIDSSESMSQAPKEDPNKDILGPWKGKLELPKSDKDDLGAAMAEAMLSPFADSLELELSEGGKFRLSMMGMPIEGSFTVDGSTITLKAETAMGLTPEEAAKKNAESKSGTKVDVESMKEPMIGTISADKSKITLRNEPKKGEKPDPSAGEMVFVRDTSGPKVVDKPTVTAEEAKLVGEYRADASRIKESDLKPEDKADIEMIRSMLGSARVTLSADNTFDMRLMVSLSGTWKVAGGKLTLNPTGAMGMSDGKSSGDPMTFLIEDGGNLLHAEDQSKASPLLYFVRK